MYFSDRRVNLCLPNIQYASETGSETLTLVVLATRAGGGGSMLGVGGWVYEVNVLVTWFAEVLLQVLLQV
jgi:hypothetical protein